MDVYRAGTDHEGVLSHHPDRAIDHGRNDRLLRRDRQDEWTLLERPQTIVNAASPFGKDDDAVAALHLARSDLVGLEGLLAIFTIEKDDADGLGAPPEDGDRPQLG